MMSIYANTMLTESKLTPGRDKYLFPYRCKQKKIDQCIYMGAKIKYTHAQNHWPLSEELIRRINF